MSKTRDFSAALQTNVKSELTSVYPASGSFLSTYLSGISPRVARFFASEGVSTLPGTIENYHTDFLSKDSECEQGVDEVFDTARTIDANTAQCVSEITDLLKEYTRLINAHASAVGSARSAPNSIFTTYVMSGCSIKETYKDRLLNAQLHIEYIDACQNEPLKTMLDEELSIHGAKSAERLREDIWTVMLYENDNPTYVADFNTFVKPIPPRDQYGIKAMTYKAPEPYRQIILENLSGVSFGKTEGHFDKDGVYQSFTACYGSKKINMDFDVANSGRDFADDDRGRYATFFHEFGHYLDDIGGGTGWATKEYRHNGESLYDMMRSGVLDSVSSETIKTVAGDSSLSHLSVTEKEQLSQIVVNQLVNGNMPGYKPISPSGKITQADIDNVASQVQSDYRNYYLSSSTRSGISDAYDGITNYIRNLGDKEDVPVSELSTTTNMGIGGNYQHGNDYWVSSFLWFKKRTSHSPAKEGFATYLADKVVGNTDGVNAYYTYMNGDVVDAYNEILGEINALK